MPAPAVTDVSAQSFDVEVVERSHEVPVLVDFWAPWCGPCRALGPVLEDLAGKAAGKFVLAKVDTEQNPAIAARFSIRGIPLVKLFVAGKEVAEFVGAQPRGAIERFLAEHLPDPVRDLLGQAQAAFDAGEVEDAAAKLPELLRAGADRPQVRLLAARVALAQDDPQAVRDHLAGIDEGADEFETAEHLRAATEFFARCREAGGEAQAAARVSTDPADGDARFAWGACLAAQGRYGEALAQFLEAVIHTRKPQGTLAHRAMLTVFGVLGRHHDLSDQFKRQLQIYL